MTRVQVLNTEKGLAPAVDEFMDRLAREGPLLKSSGDVYIKVNGVHCQAHAYTSPELLRTVIEALFRRGARRVFVIENSTIGNVTRLVFALTGYAWICRETGAHAIYLDEERTDSLSLNAETAIRIPRTLTRIMRQREAVTYINLPKLKTHNATVVTLGIKNQFGFFSHRDRKALHDDRLHGYLADFYSLLRPDWTLIDAAEAVSGEMPVRAFASRLIKPLGLLIGGRDTLAVDVAGARMLGYRLEEVPHLANAAQRDLGEGNWQDITIEGDVRAFDRERTEWNLVDQFPADVKIIRGRDKICREGCEINTLAAIQLLAYDYHGRGGYFVLLGKGFDPGLADELAREGYRKGFLAGACAIEEVGADFKRRFGKKNIYTSDACCNVAATVSGLLKLTSLSAFDMLPASMPRSLRLFASAKLHGSRAILARLF